ncbi:hypothetical protein GCM10010405_29750 [Streptomyces macrosporus]|uniref:Uncharacterized protein n=1 Tax=Streptomyces macrosporus TaxID=44032 RepID=A0ABN3JYR4_9ACTN
MVHGDPGARGFPRQEARGGAQKVSGVHQDDAAVHAPPTLGTTGTTGATTVTDGVRPVVVRFFRVRFESARPCGACRSGLDPRRGGRPVSTVRDGAPLKKADYAGQLSDMRTVRMRARL